MNNKQRLSLAKWKCKYRKKELYGDLRKYLGKAFKNPAQRRECKILVRTSYVRSCSHVNFDSTQICSFTSGWLHKGQKRHPHRRAMLRPRKRISLSSTFWARGYHVSTAGKDEEAIRRYT